MQTARDPFIGEPSLTQHVADRCAVERATAAISKQSEAHLPADEQRAVFIPGDDPVELRPVRRMSFTERSHVEIGIKGGQGRSGAEVEESADRLLLALSLILAVFIAAALVWA